MPSLVDPTAANIGNVHRVVSEPMPRWLGVSLSSVDLQMVLGCLFSDKA